MPLPGVDPDALAASKIWRMLRRRRNDIYRVAQTGAPMLRGDRELIRLVCLFTYVALTSPAANQLDPTTSGG